MGCALRKDPQPVKSTAQIAETPGARRVARSTKEACQTSITTAKRGSIRALSAMSAGFCAGDAVIEPVGDLEWDERLKHSFFQTAELRL
jgi:hypothetical protein